MKYKIATFYHFADFSDYHDWQEKLYEVMRPYDMRGTILIAAEGINGTISGCAEGVKNLFAFIRADERFANINIKYSQAEIHAFPRLKVRLKKEIVSLGKTDINPAQQTGGYVAPKDWNALIARDDVLVLDTRNDYEVAIGTFHHAISPNTKHFRQFPDYVKENWTQDESNKQRPIAMFCTGGIRCEKASAYLKQQGFEKVYQLHGGILKYLEEVPAEESLWQGECFVFDQRVSLNEEREKGSYLQCYACRMPLSYEDSQNPYYEKGISCHHCYGKKSEKKKQGLAMREKQIQLAMKRGESHHAGQSNKELENNYVAEIRAKATDKNKT